MNGPQGRRGSPATRRVALLRALLATLAAAAALAGCGGSDQPDPEAVEQRIDRERADAAADARQEQRLEDLEDEVKRLRRARARAQRAATATISPATSAGSTSASRTFHAPSGNVSCRVDGDSASCTVAAIAATFVIPASGGEAYVQDGAALPRSSGEPVDWDSTVTVGSVTCRIPPADEASGISCVDADTGHGFEASRVAARQKTY